MQVSKNIYSTNIAFNANIKSPKLRFKKDDFFVNIRGFGRNSEWAKNAKSTADLATKLIRKNTACENVMKIIAVGVRDANKNLLDMVKVFHSGILRVERNGWNKPTKLWQNLSLGTNYSDIKRYKGYQQKLDKVVYKPINNPFKDISLTRPKIQNDEHFLKHGDAKKIHNAFKHVFKIYEHFVKNYHYKDVNPKQLKAINNDICTIRWILAHATPWERGSDAISNIFMRAMFKSLGIKSYPLKKGLSLDMEAYCTNLRDYRKNFTTYFVKPPEIIQ